VMNINKQFFWRFCFCYTMVCFLLICILQSMFFICVTTLMEAGKLLFEHYQELSAGSLTFGLM